VRKDSNLQMRFQLLTAPSMTTTVYLVFRRAVWDNSTQPPVLLTNTIGSLRRTSWQTERLSVSHKRLHVM